MSPLKLHFFKDRRVHPYAGVQATQHCRFNVYAERIPEGHERRHHRRPGSPNGPSSAATLLATAHPFPEQADNYSRSSTLTARLCACAQRAVEVRASCTVNTVTTSVSTS